MKPHTTSMRQQVTYLCIARLLRRQYMNALSLDCSFEGSPKLQCSRRKHWIACQFNDEAAASVLTHNTPEPLFTLRRQIEPASINWSLRASGIELWNFLVLILFDWTSPILRAKPAMATELWTWKRDESSSAEHCFECCQLFGGENFDFLSCN